MTVKDEPQASAGREHPPGRAQAPAAAALLLTCSHLRVPAAAQMPKCCSSCETTGEWNSTTGPAPGSTDAVLPLTWGFRMCWDPHCQPGVRCRRALPALNPIFYHPISLRNQPLLRSGFPMADLAWSKPAQQARWSSCRLGCKFSNFLLCSQGLLILLIPFECR